MRFALEEARAAAAQGEVPVGCVIVQNGQIIARAHNRREMDSDATAHAETIAIREACRKTGSWRLGGCTLYVTLEPCLMCAGAIYNARVGSVVYGLRDSAAGAMGGVLNVFQENFSFSPKIYGGVLAEDSARLLQVFFETVRKNKLPD